MKLPLAAVGFAVGFVGLGAVCGALMMLAMYCMRERARKRASESLCRLEMTREMLVRAEQYNRDRSRELTSLPTAPNPNELQPQPSGDGGQPLTAVASAASSRRTIIIAPREPASESRRQEGWMWDER
ncbi:hypothetical protein DIPPA_04290 [Diplonema papillatum]|nr:hypothetical protein DIPPA_04290 [Diplonema papillatum]